MSELGDDRLKAIAEVLQRGEAHSGETVRTLLSWFNAQRRGSWVVSTIREALDRADLTTEPDFESAYVDSVVEFRTKGTSGPGKSGAPVSGNLSASSRFAITASGSVTNGTAEEAQAPTPSSDPSFRLSKLAAANQVPISLKPDSTLAEAVTTMLSHDYSQVPVMTSEREVKGVISWKSIASRNTLGHTGNAVRDFMDVTVEILESTASFFEAIRVIADKDYVLVRGPDKRITGIVTSTDLSLQIQSLTEPFLLLAEIENDLRRALHAKFSREELAISKDPADTSRTISSVHDMTFGEYVRHLESPDNWQKFSANLDRSVFISGLKKIGTIRNEVMHFDPDPIAPEDLEILRSFSRFAQRLRDLGAT